MFCFIILNDLENVIFIVGCQRTGTTLLRLIVDSHSKITSVDEPESYSALNKFKQTNSSFQCFKIPLFTEQMNEDFFSDPSIDFIITNIFSSAKLLFSIRDVRDTISSMINLKQSGSTWFKIWPTKTIDYWTKTIPNFEKKYADDLQLISESTEKLYANASFYWKIKTQSYFDYKNTNSTVFGIKYEELVTEPKTTIEKIINFLDLEWEDSLLSHHTLNHSQIDDANMSIGNTNATKPIFSTSLGQYENKLSSTQQETILSISGSLMKELGYKI